MKTQVEALPAPDPPIVRITLDLTADEVDDLWSKLRSIPYPGVPTSGVRDLIRALEAVPGQRRNLYPAGVDRWNFSYVKTP